MTKHEIIVGNSNNVTTIANRSISLIVTSPPYPMIEMWDQMFADQNPQIAYDLQSGDGMAAFNKM
ncbi:MAG: site-specific DNA-methyltransferase, partial [Eubacteriales bacterium]|nr:site-specific DNA-methyltransferase [Eubacteriales bacterium]